MKDNAKSLVKRSLGEGVYAHMSKYYGLLRRYPKMAYQMASVYGKPKIFCIGRHKTGTTSLAQEFEMLDFVVGDQRAGELLLKDWVMRDFKRIIQYCYTAQVFQDTPFALPYTYVVLDHYFPNSKFILSVRDDAEQWYNSLVSFHSELWGDGKNFPTMQELKNATYIYKGWPYYWYKHVDFGVADDNLNDKDRLIASYEQHNRNVLQYFRFRKKDFLVVNLSRKDDYSKFCEFLGVEQKRDSFPWVNKTSDVGRKSG